MPDIFIVTGDVHSGKTGKLLNWSGERSDVHGILTPVLEGTRYFLDIHSREQFRMEADDKEEALVVGRYRFSRNSFNKATRLLENSIDKNGWLVVDEIGPLELRGEGFSDFLKTIVRERKERTLLVVRKALIDDVISQFELYRFEKRRGSGDESGFSAATNSCRH